MATEDCQGHQLEADTQFRRVREHVFQMQLNTTSHKMLVSKTNSKLTVEPQKPQPSFTTVRKKVKT